MQDSSDKKQSLKFNRQITTFLICVFISTILWLLISLSVNNSALIEVPVSYEGFEDVKTVVNKLPRSFKLKVTTSDFKILMRKYFFYNDTIKIHYSYVNVEHQGSHAYLHTKEIQSEIEGQIRPQIKVLSIMPDTVHFYFDNKIEKKIPVILISSLSYEKQHQLADSIKLEPDSVIIIGSAKLLKNISGIKTYPLKIEHLKESTIKNVVLNKASLVNDIKSTNYDTSRIVISSSEVRVNIPIEKYTESVVEVNINTIGFPSGYSVILSPRTVKIKYLVSYANYDKVKPDMFSINIEYSGQNEKSCTAKLINQPAFVTVTRIEPEKINYTLHAGL